MIMVFREIKPSKDSENQFITLNLNIGKESKRFIETVYRSGGDFALRGYFTAEFFEKLGFHDLNVVGCPSLFQLGNQLKVSDDKVAKEQFKVAVNGNAEIALPLLKRYNSIYYDQDYLFDLLYDKHYYDRNPVLPDGRG